jgi:hypothetical protein
MPLSTIFQLYHGGLFYWWRKQEYSEKTTNLSQVTDKIITKCCIKYISSWTGFELTLVVIGIDCIDSCKFNYHTMWLTKFINNIPLVKILSCKFFFRLCSTYDKMFTKMWLTKFIKNIPLVKILSCNLLNLCCNWESPLTNLWWFWLVGLWCLMHISTIFQ